ncbi:unnamed protein product [Musa acuminata subsp. malaccensis]|uniref:(wild Malaysian banana) hypothetical protein n=1 Tax=Musa acuminata subsp. malaccensis TaxID=214687 RepID=A0A8D7FFY9_MUSAM|nr:unnamed protein product [Musa acuminata subsp. malaccensis]
MDICDFKLLEATARQNTVRTEENYRRLLLPSERNNAVSATRRPRSVASRYKSGMSSTPVSTPSSPRRYPSPNAGHTSLATGLSLPKRSQSAERRRPTTPSSRFSASPSPSRPSTPASPSSRSTTPVRDRGTEMCSTPQRLFSNRAPNGLWPSIRSPSSSFQSESVVIPVSKREKLVVNSLERANKSPGNVAPERKRTPLRGRNSSDQSENSKPLETSNAKVMDQHRWPGMLGGRLSTNALSRSVDLSDKLGRSILTVASQGDSPKRTNPSPNSATRVTQLSLSEMAERLSNVGDGILERDTKSVVNLSSPTSVRHSSVVTRSSKTQSLLIPGSRRPSSPSKVLSTPSSTARGMLSPVRSRPSTPILLSSNLPSRVGGTPSVLNYSVDLRKGKKNSNHVEEAHQLRLLYNANLQWRFVNAQAVKTLSNQKMSAENLVYGVWNNISKFLDPVIMNRIDLQHLELEMKLGMILKEQMAYLEHWVALESEHYSSLSGLVEALNASTIRLPIKEGAKVVDVLAVKNAIGSAVDIMQAMSSSICHLLSKVEGTKSLVSELSCIAANEKYMLDECRELLDVAASMQVKESSLRTHIIQIGQDARELV